MTERFIGTFMCLLLRDSCFNERCTISYFIIKPLFPIYIQKKCLHFYPQYPNLHAAIFLKIKHLGSISMKRFDRQYLLFNMLCIIYRIYLFFLLLCRNTFCIKLSNLPILLIRAWRIFKPRHLKCILQITAYWQATISIIIKKSLTTGR